MSLGIFVDVKTGERKIIKLKERKSPYIPSPEERGIPINILINELLKRKYDRGSST